MIALGSLKIFESFKIATHFQKSTPTQEGFSSNLMAAPEALWPLQILLSRYKAGIVRNTILTRSKPHPYGMLAS